VRIRVGTTAIIAIIVAGCSGAAGPAWTFGPPVGTPMPTAASAVTGATAAASVLPAPASASADTPSPTPTPLPAATPPLTSAAVHDDTATLYEFKITLASDTLAAGSDTFKVTNAGTIGHEFVIKRTGLTDSALPTKADGTIDEESPELSQVGEVEIATPGATKDLAENLAPGTYVFFCNIPGHYAGGMHGSFTVTSSG
jgi:uncharacterized cupredoxin-like copper-binding protein